MPAILARISAPVSLWNFSSAAAPDPNVAAASSTNPAMRHQSFIEFFAAFAGLVQVGLFVRRFLQHTFQGQTRGLVSKLHVFSGGPDLVAASARFLSGFETKPVPLDAPRADALVAHGSDRERAVAFEYFPPMRFIGQFHP